MPRTAIAPGAGTVPVASSASGRPAAVVIAHLADLHLDGTAMPLLRLEAVAARLRASARAIDMIVVTGDLVEASSSPDAAANYAMVDELLASIAPVAWCPGNSDDRVLMRRSGRSDVCVGSVRVLTIDSTVDSSVHGLITPETISNLRHKLATALADERVLIALHHPPVELGHAAVDQWRAFGESGELAALIAESPQVIATLAGHTHLATFSSFGGKPLLVAPGVHSGGQPGIEHSTAPDRLLDESTAPAYALHRVEASGRVVTNVVPVCSEVQATGAQPSTTAPDPANALTWLDEREQEQR